MATPGDALDKAKAHFGLVPSTGPGGVGSSPEAHPPADQLPSWDLHPYTVSRPHMPAGPHVARVADHEARLVALENRAGCAAANALAVALRSALGPL